MTHYTRTYKGNAQQRRTQALSDCLNFLGTKRYRKVREAIAQERRADVPLIRQRKAIRFIAASLCLSGIQGYPATALTIDILANGA